jgi:hypothetical protein
MVPVRVRPPRLAAPLTHDRGSRAARARVRRALVADTERALPAQSALSAEGIVPPAPTAASHPTETTGRQNW